MARVLLVIAFCVGAIDMYLGNFGRALHAGYFAALFEIIFNLHRLQNIGLAVGYEVSEESTDSN